jgi:hypothetical protein
MVAATLQQPQKQKYSHLTKPSRPTKLKARNKAFRCSKGQANAFVEQKRNHMQSTSGSSLTQSEPTVEERGEREERNIQQQEYNTRVQEDLNPAGRCSSLL